jgi:hypothetical protein
MFSCNSIEDDLSKTSSITKAAVMKHASRKPPFIFRRLIEDMLTGACSYL